MIDWKSTAASLAVVALQVGTPVGMAVYLNGRDNPMPIVVDGKDYCLTTPPGRIEVSQRLPTMLGYSSIVDEDMDLHPDFVRTMTFCGRPPMCAVGRRDVTEREARIFGEAVQHLKAEK